MIDSSSGAGKVKPLGPVPVDAEKIKKQFREVSQLYEKHFMREMMKAMRATVPDSNFIKQNQGEKIFRSQLDEEYVEKWGDRGGIGLSDLIYNQLVEKYGPSMGLAKPLEKAQGPLPLDEKSNFPRATVNIKEKSSTQTQLQFDLGPSKNGAASGRELRAPWSGYLIKKIQLAPDEWALEMNHGNGLNSQFSFRGTPVEGPLGQAVQPGERIGLLSPDSTQFNWNLRTQLKTDQAQGLGSESRPGTIPGPDSAPVSE
jgi:flagellar protein FlgJ